MSTTQLKLAFDASQLIYKPISRSDLYTSQIDNYIEMDEDDSFEILATGMVPVDELCRGRYQIRKKEIKKDHLKSIFENMIKRHNEGEKLILKQIIIAANNSDSQFIEVAQGHHRLEAWIKFCTDILGKKRDEIRIPCMIVEVKKEGEFFQFLNRVQMDLPEPQLGSSEEDVKKYIEHQLLTYNTELVSDIKNPDNDFDDYKDEIYEILNKGGYKNYFSNGRSKRNFVSGFLEEMFGDSYTSKVDRINEPKPNEINIAMSESWGFQQKNPPYGQDWDMDTIGVTGNQDSILKSYYHCGRSRMEQMVRSGDPMLTEIGYVNSIVYFTGIGRSRGRAESELTLSMFQNLNLKRKKFLEERIKDNIYGRNALYTIMHSKITFCYQFEGKNRKNSETRNLMFIYDKKEKTFFHIDNKTGKKTKYDTFFEEYNLKFDSAPPKLDRTVEIYKEIAEIVGFEQRTKVESRDYASQAWYTRDEAKDIFEFCGVKITDSEFQKTNISTKVMNHTLFSKFVPGWAWQDTVHTHPSVENAEALLKWVSKSKIK